MMTRSWIDLSQNTRSMMATSSSQRDRLSGSSVKPGIRTLEGNYSRDFIEIDNISNDEYREAINLVWELVEIRHSDSMETEAREYARQYADAGVDEINREMEYRGEFDTIGLLSIFEGE